MNIEETDAEGSHDISLFLVCFGSIEKAKLITPIAH